MRQSGFDFKKLALFLFVITLPLLSIYVQRRPGEVPWYLVPFYKGTNIVQSGFYSFSRGVRGTTGLYLDLISVKKLNQTLNLDNSKLRSELAQLSEIKLENERLKKMLEYKEGSKMTLLSARVIGMDLFRENRSIRIDKGKKDGLLKNQAVIGLEGAIGYIFNVDTSVSQVLVISDRYITVDAIVQRSRAWGVVEGVSIGLSKMKYLHRTDDVQTGDIIVTSGMDEVFPKGFPIGTVAQVKKEKYGVDQEVEVTPFVDPSKLEEVFVIIKTNEEVTKESNL